MKGAIADPCVTTISPPIKRNTIISGRSHHFFSFLRNANNSDNKSNIFRIEIDNLLLFFLTFCDYANKS